MTTTNSTPQISIHNAQGLSIQDVQTAMLEFKDDLPVYAYVQAYEKLFPVQAFMMLEKPNALYHDDQGARAANWTSLYENFKYGEKNFDEIAELPMRIFGQMANVVKVEIGKIAIAGKEFHALLLS